jgi:hypothetical protein
MLSHNGVLTSALKDYALYARPQRYQGIAMYSDAMYSDPASAPVCGPALKVTKVSLFTMIPPLPRCVVPP